MEMKRNLLLLIGLCMAVCVQAQKKNFSYKFYGQVRGDLFYNSRANAEIVDGLFHLYPKDVALDADGKDLNASPNGSVLPALLPFGNRCTRTEGWFGQDFLETGGRFPGFG